MHAHLRPSLLVLTGLGVLLLSGCAKAMVSATRPTAGNVARPDRVIVHDFAVTPRDVGLDRGLGPRAAREVSAGPQSEEEVRVGQAVARALSDKLVQNLRDHGINAARAGEKGSPGPTTASVTGEFLRIDQGDRTLRTMVGFGLGGSELRTRIHIYQGAGRSARLVAEGETSTQSGLKPGIGVMLPLGAAAGTAATAAVVSGSTTIASEAFFATVEADARRTAEAVAERIGDYYRRQGWAWR